MFGDCSSGKVTTIGECTDGTSNTFLVGENSPNYNGQLTWTSGHGAWAGTHIPLNWLTKYKDGQVDPSDGTVCSVAYLGNVTQAKFCYRNQFYIWGFKSKHPGGGNFAMADGSVKFIKQTIHPRIYNAIGTRNVGEVISADTLLTPGESLGPGDAARPPPRDTAGTDPARCLSSAVVTTPRGPCSMRALDDVLDGGDPGRDGRLRLG